MATRLSFALVLVPLVGACRGGECGPGFDIADGQCRPKSPCGACNSHEFCDQSVAPNVCTCAPGYEREASSCVFAALIRDPGFQQDVNTGPWGDDKGKGATVLPLAPGEINLGEGTLDESVICNAGSLVQAVKMPSYDVAEPFVVEVTYQAEGVNGLAVGFDRSWTRLPPTTSGWTTEAFCLGDGGYAAEPSGGTVAVRLSASERLANCYDEEPGSNIRIDTFTIRPADEGRCPAPGSALNGSANADGGGWVFLTEPGGSADAGFAERAGHNASSGARVARNEGESGRATMTTEISVPLPRSLPSPALRFWWKGTDGALLDVELGTLVNLEDRGRRVDTLRGTGATLNDIYCLPPWTHGSVLDLSFSLPDEGTEEAELIVDDVEIISDPDCGDQQDILDPSFESAPNRWLGASVSAFLDSVSLRPNDPLARTGSSVLELSFEDPGSELTMETFVLVPEAEGDQLPAVTFHSLGMVTRSTEAEWILGRSGVERATVATEISWFENEVCLPSEWAGRWFRLQIRVKSTGAPSGRDRVLLDDFSLGRSSCQTQ